MANNWQYATLSAGERLSRIRSGEDDIYVQELARAKELMENRKELGLDISEQLEWINKLDYVKTNNNGRGGLLTPEEIDYNTKVGNTFSQTTQPSGAVLSLQQIVDAYNKNSGVTSGNISNIINSGNNTTSTTNTSGTANTNTNISSNITSAENIPSAPNLPAFDSSHINSNYEQELKAFMESQQKRRDELELTLKKELNEKYGIMDEYYKQLNDSVESDTMNKKSDYYANAVSRLPSMYEKFANSGLSFDGGRVRSEQMSYNNALNRSLSTLDAQAINAINTNNLNKATERSNAYSEYANRLAQENSRLDDMEYQMIRDLQDNAFKQQQLAWDQYQYNTQYEFDKYKYEQQLRESAEQKTVEQQRWEKEFGFQIDAHEFDKLLKQNQLALENEKYKFDVEKYQSEYAMKQQEYELKLQQYQDDLYFKQQDYDLKNKEFNLKVDLAEFNKMLDNLKYTFDVEKFEKEYALKQSEQDFDVQKFNFDIEKFYAEYNQKQQQYENDYNLKQYQYENDYNLKQYQYEKDYDLKQYQYENDYNLKQQQYENDYNLKQYQYQNDYDLKQQQSDRDYNFKVQQEETQNAQWEREMSLKETIQQSNMTQAEKDYALKYLDLERKYAESTSSSSSSSKSTNTSSSSKTSTTSNTSSSSNTSNNSNTNTNNSSSGTSNATTLYEAALTTAMWMKTQYSYNGKNTIRKFSNNDIDNWINTLQLTSSEKAKLKKAVGVE